jgi:methylglutaconyl-CoA hydratase
VGEVERVDEFVFVERRRAGEAGVSRGFAEIVLDRGAKRNALTPSVLGAVRGAVERLGGEREVGAIVLAGEGRSFCAGFDLGMMAAEAASLRSMLAGLSECVGAMRRCPKPVVVAAHGAAVAGGCALLAGADLVVADQRCKLGYPVTMLGVSPAVSAPTLANAIGLGAARRRLLDPGLIDGAEGRRVGLVHVVVDSAEDARPRGQIEAQRLAGKPAAAVAATKRWLNRLEGSDADGGMSAGLDASLALVGGAEERSRIAAAVGGDGR